MLTKIISAAFLFSVCGIALLAIGPSEHLTVKEISISGNSEASSSEIIKRSGIRAGSTSMLFFSTSILSSFIIDPFCFAVATP